MNLYLLVFLCLKYLRSEELLKFDVFPAPIISSVVFFFFFYRKDGQTKVSKGLSQAVLATVCTRRGV